MALCQIRAVPSRRRTGQRSMGSLSSLVNSAAATADQGEDGSPGEASASADPTCWMSPTQVLTSAGRTVPNALPGMPVRTTGSATGWRSRLQNEKRDGARRRAYWPPRTCRGAAPGRRWIPRPAEQRVAPHTPVGTAMPARRAAPGHAAGAPRIAVERRHLDAQRLDQWIGTASRRRAISAVLMIHTAILSGCDSSVSRGQRVDHNLYVLRLPLCTLKSVSSFIG